MRKPINRRSFLKVSALSTGGLMLSFNMALGSDKKEVAALTELNGFVKITSDGQIIIMAPNPEAGQNIKTASAMIVAEELDVNFKEIQVVQADLDTKHFSRQFIGGSQAIRQSWETWRTAGATARYLILQAAAKNWAVPMSELSTSAGKVMHKKSGKTAAYGDFAIDAAGMEIPEKVDLKERVDFKIIGHNQKNVEMKNIVTGKPLYGIDYKKEGMLYAMIIHPDAFGKKLKSFDASRALKMPGIKDVFSIEVFKDDFDKQFFDTISFNEVVAVVGESTWQVMQAKKAVKVEWEPFEAFSENRSMFGRKMVRNVPAGLESSEDHYAAMKAASMTNVDLRRKDGDPEAAFASAHKIIERSYEAPFLAHNCMEPMNFFADVTDERAELAGPLQKPEFTEIALSARIGLPLDKIDIKMTRLGGGYGRRSYAHWLLEAALISQKVKAPVKLQYSREDDMTAGIYRPTYRADYRAALDENNNLIAFHVKGGGIPESPMAENRFPAGAVDNYLAEEYILDSNLTTGSFRAPRSNFIASAEQSFLDEVAEAAGKDPFDFRLKLLQKAKDKPVGSRNDYDAGRFIEVTKLLREKSKWDERKGSQNLGLSVYFCHNSYTGHVLEVEMKDGEPKVTNVTSAVDCGLVINPDAAINLTEGAVIDGIGTALFGKISFRNGKAESSNFDSYRMIRMNEAPKSIDVHFVENDYDPTGMGEPAYPPVFGALANALYKATGKRFYRQPFSENLEPTDS